MENLLLTIDVGTTAIKFDVFSNKAKIDSTSVRIETYRDGQHVTQNPLDILEKIKVKVKKLSVAFPTIRQISFSTAMHTLIPIQTNRKSNTMYLWSDNCAANTVKKFKKDKEIAKRFYEKTGTPIHSMSPFTKLLFFKATDSKWYESVHSWSDIKSFLMEHFVGESVLDYSLASATGLFNSIDMSWDEEILDYLELEKETLPKLVHPKTLFAISKSTAEELGLNESTQIMIGASDGCLASFASLKSNHSDMSVTLGTSGAVRKISSSRFLSKPQTTFCYYLNDNQWVIGGPTNNGGIILEWLSSLLYDDKTTLFNNLPTSTKKSELLFLPYLQGERAPIWDENQTGSFVGLTLMHGKEEMVQSVLEGILFNLKYISISLPNNSYEEVIMLNGGVFQNPFIAQMVADIFNQRCISSAQAEPSQGLQDWWSSAETTTESNGEIYVPNEKEQSYYQAKYQQFVSMVENLNK